MAPEIRTSAGPTAEDVAQGTQFCSVIDRGKPRDSGEIFDQSGAKLWCYEVDASWPYTFPLTLFLKADFIVRDPTGQEVLRVRRVGRMSPRFAILQNGQIVGWIAYRNIIRTRCTLTFVTGSTWTFRQRLFTVCFYGDSDANQRLWVMVGPSKRGWNMLLPPGTKDAYLPGALAFLHREYWRH